MIAALGPAIQAAHWLIVLIVMGAVIGAFGVSAAAPASDLHALAALHRLQAGTLRSQRVSAARRLSLVRSQSAVA